jgi:hypothetical protein
MGLPRIDGPQHADARMQQWSGAFGSPMISASVASRPGSAVTVGGGLMFLFKPDGERQARRWP